MVKHILCIVGASGSGKTTLSNMLQNKNIPNLVSFTTRNRRRGEADGVDYYFYTKEDLENVTLVEETVYDGHVYGLTKEEIEGKLAKHDILNVVVNAHGATILKELYPKETVVINLTVEEELVRERMAARGDAPESIKKRIRHAHENNEFTLIEDADFYLENDELENTFSNLMEIIDMLD